MSITLPRAFHALSHLVITVFFLCVLQRVSLKLLYSFNTLWASQGAQVVKNLPARARVAGDAGLIPGSGRSPGGRNGNPLQYSFLGNPMDRGAWQATVHGTTKESDMTSGKTRTYEVNQRQW